jgi:hypothetical protein
VATQSELAETYRVEQARISAEVSRDVLDLWLNGYRPGDSDIWRLLIVALMALVNRFRGESSRSAINYYLASRAAASVPDLHVPRPAQDSPRELIDATAQITGARTFGRSLTANVGQKRAAQNSGVQLAGAMARVSLDAGRETILNATQEDHEAIGWIRITDANPCAFCAMLASRGPVFGEDTVAFQAHAHCACVSAPVWSRDEAWLGHSEDLYQQWKRETAGESGKDAIRAWRRYWNSRDKSEGDTGGSP